MRVKMILLALTEAKSFYGVLLNISCFHLWGWPSWPLILASMTKRIGRICQKLHDTLVQGVEGACLRCHGLSVGYNLQLLAHQPITQIADYARSGTCNKHLRWQPAWLPWQTIKTLRYVDIS